MNGNVGTETFREQIRTVYTSTRTYAYHVLEDLTPDEADWRPANTNARTIKSYAMHLVNTEIYWLRALDGADFSYLSRENSFKEIIDLYKSLEAHYLDLLKSAPADDLKIIATKYDKDEKVVQRGTIAWTMLRIAIHAFGHVSHINHIRYSLGNPPVKDRHWWTVTENLINTMGTKHVK